MICTYEHVQRCDMCREHSVLEPVCDGHCVRQTRHLFEPAILPGCKWLMQLSLWCHKRVSVCMLSCKHMHTYMYAYTCVRTYVCVQCAIVCSLSCTHAVRSAESKSELAYQQAQRAQQVALPSPPKSQVVCVRQSNTIGFK